MGRRRKTPWEILYNRVQKDINTILEIKNRFQNRKNIMTTEQMVTKSVSLITKVSAFERDLDDLNAIVLKYNPGYKLKNQSDYSDRISRKMGEFIKIKELAAKGKITKVEMDEILLQKQQEMESMDRELEKIIVNGSYMDALQIDFVNSMFEAIYYLYFDENGNVTNSGGTMFRDLDENGRRKVLSKIYEDNNKVRELFGDRETFLNATIETSSEYDRRETERILNAKKRR